MTLEEQFLSEYAAQSVGSAARRMSLPNSLSNSMQRQLGTINFPLPQPMMNQNQILARAAQIMAVSSAASVHQPGFFNPTVAAARAAASNRAVNFELGHALATAGRNNLLPFLAPKPNMDAAALSINSHEDSVEHAGARRRRTQETAFSIDADANSKKTSAVAPNGPYKKLEIPPESAIMPSMQDMQLEGIETSSIDENDVLCGRGGGTNNHVGNERFRELVAAQKLVYMRTAKRKKPLVSRDIVRAVRNQNPPGRFLAKNDQLGLWYDIGDQKAREKTSQALREGAPQIRDVISMRYGISPTKNGKDDNRLEQAEADDSFQAAQSGLHPNRPPEQHGLFQSSPKAMPNFGQIQGEMALSWAAQQQGRKVDPIASPTLSMLQQHHSQVPRAPMHDFRNTFPQPVVIRDRLLGLGRGRGDSSRARLNSTTLGGQNQSLSHSGMVAPSRLELPDAQDRKRSHSEVDAALTFRDAQSRKRTLSEVDANGDVCIRNGTLLGSQFSHDCTRRLMLAETVAQETARGTITEMLKAEEYRISLYLDAGLFNIDPGDMARYLASGKSESDIVEEAYNRLANNGKRDTSTLLPKYRRVESNGGALRALGALTQQTINDALQGIIGSRAHIAVAK